MRTAPRIGAIAVLLALAAVASAVFGPGPNSIVVPSTGQTLAVAITAPPDNSIVLVPPGTAAVAGTCTIGAPPGQPISVLYVLDVSGSTDLSFMTQNGIPLVDANGNGIAGDAGDNLNADAGDSEAGEVLDGAIAGVLALHASIGNPSNVSVGLEAFATNAAAADVGPQGGLQVFTSPPQLDANGLAGPDIGEVVRTFRSEFNNPAGGSIGKFTAVSQSVLGSATSFKKALQVMNTTLAQFPAAPTKIVFFLSDGESNQDGRCFQGACTAELNAAVAAGIKINTVGVGADADGTDLQFIATTTGGTYTQVTDPSDLTTVLPATPPAGIDRVEVNGVQVPVGPLGNFTATATCGGLGTRTGTVTCFASDPASTNISADITIICNPAPTTTSSTTSSTTVASTTVPTTSVPTTTVTTTSVSVSTTSSTSTTIPPACGNGVVEAGEQCDDGNTQNGDCCSSSCHAEAAGGTCGPSPTQCSARQCNGSGQCITNLLPHGTPCDDGDVCTESDQCDSGGVCTGQGGPDSDGDGECDRKEIACGCNPNDPKEGCLLPNRLGGLPFNRAGEVLLTYYSPTRTRPDVTSDESCDQVGECSDDGRCVRGKIRDVCTSNADCAEPFDTCRYIINWAGISDLTLDSARLGATDLPAFLPVTPGCSRRVDVTVGPTRSVLRLKAHGTIDGRLWRDRDVFKPHH